jgi:hypothetical protein
MHVQRACAAPRSIGHRPLLARCIWAAVLAITLAIASASLPAYLRQLRTPCSSVACEYQQLTPGQLNRLEAIGLSVDTYVALTITFLIIGLVVCWGVSALIIWRHPGDRMALLVALLLVMLGPLPIATALPTGSSPWQAPHNYFVFVFVSLFLLVFLIFPSGHFMPRWTRWLLVALLFGQLPAFFVPDLLALSDAPASVLGFLLSLVAMATAVGVQLYRYWYASAPLERQQTKWIMVGLAVPITALFCLTIPELWFPAFGESNVVYMLALNEFEFLLPLCIPLSFGFAILRYRLWDIDALVNRALVYGTLTATLTAVFVGLVIGLQALLGGLLGDVGLIGRDNSVAIVISTLVIVVLVRPLGRSVQALIDRRFYRRKYDAAQTLAAFSATLRQEVDLDDLRERVLVVVQETMQPTHASLWLHSVHLSPGHEPEGGSERGESARTGMQQYQSTRAQ